MAAQAEVIFHPGIKPETVLISAIDGHSYHKHSIMNGGRMSLQCMYAKTKRNCHAKASVNPDGSGFRRGRIGFHNHPPPLNILHQRRFRTAVLSECKLEENFTQSLKKLYNKVRRRLRLSADQIGGLTYVKLRSSMVRARRENLPPIPHSLSELADILDDPQYAFLVSSMDGEDLIYMGKFGQTNEGTRCIMFVSNRMLMYILEKVKDVLSDATFCVPTVLHCRQIWNIVTLRRNHAVVLVRFVMQSKSESCYTVCLEALKAILPEFRPQSVMCDHEPAECNAWEAVYPLAILSGCLFHSSKAIALHALELGLVPTIRVNEILDSLVRSLCALAFLPVTRLEEGIVSIATRAYDHGLFLTLSPMLDYVRRTWFRPTTKCRFSVFGCPDRTTNACESVNATLARACGTKKPSVFAFLHAIKELEDSTWFDVQDLSRGWTCSRGRPLSALANDEVVKNLSTDLINGHIEVGEFLQEVSRRIQGVYDMVLNF